MFLFPSFHCTSFKLIGEETGFLAFHQELAFCAEFSPFLPPLFFFKIVCSYKLINRIGKPVIFQEGIPIFDSV